IMLENQRARLVNLDGITGTLLNGKPIEQAVLEPDDEVTVGPVTFRIQKTGSIPNREQGQAD
ncbi:MAG: FHA domain-containing protein, partial [Planctomycetota bacterium]|nr:FHA domain-containing protein [Planctomycetota bacterium]